MTTASTPSLHAARRAALRQPDNADVQHALALAALTRHDFPTARQALETCLALDPHHPGARLAMARSHLAHGQTQAAIEHLRLGAQGTPTDPATASQLAGELFELGLIEASVDVLRHAATAAPQNPDLQLLMGQALEDIGERDGAARAFAAALALRPGWGHALGGLLRVQREQAAAEHVDQAQTLLDSDDLDDEARAALGFGLGRVHERRQQPDQAFAAWRQANQARRRVNGALDRGALADFIESRTHLFNANVLARRPSRDAHQARPIFIVGMPRSGTTLLEQMLAAHPQATGFGELTTLSRLAHTLRLPARPPPAAPPHYSTFTSDDALARAAGHYLAELDRRRPDRAARSVDKAPLNFFHVGLIALLFPQARVILCERDPRDTLLSVYSENFADHQHFATDLDDLVFYYNQYRRLTDHWLATLPGLVRPVQYETLVEQPEEQLRALLAWLELPWDEQCLNYHRHAGAVLTPSKWQVRSPLYRSSIGRWRHYRAHLQPFIDAFGAD